MDCHGAGAPRNDDNYCGCATLLDPRCLSARACAAGMTGGLNPQLLILQPFDFIAQAGGFFEFQIFGGFVHAGF